MLRSLAFALLLLAVPARAQLSAPERRIAATVAAERARTEALLERLVRQNSGTLNRDGVRAVGQMMRAELDTLGFDVRWIDQAAQDRAGHLVATHRGTGRGKRLLLIGHLDTVFEPESPFAGYEVRDGRAYGPGVGDDKGGLAVIVAALRAMAAAGTLAPADIVVVLTGDEERTGAPLAAARADLVAAGRAADVALEFENLAREGDRDYGTVARRGSVDWTLTATGRTGHSSAVFGDDLGYGAIYEVTRILDAFRTGLREPNLTYNVGVLAGGTPATLDADGFRATASGKTNIVAAQAVARGDLRALTPEQEARARAAMEAVVARHLPGTDARIAFSDGYPPMAPSAGNTQLLARLNAVNADLELPAMPAYDPARRGAADSAFVAADLDVLAGMGAAGGGAHAEGEWIDLASLPRQATRAAILMTRLAREPR